MGYGFGAKKGGKKVIAELYFAQSIIRINISPRQKKSEKKDDIIY